MRTIFVACALLALTAGAVAVAPTASAHVCHTFYVFYCGGCNDGQVFHWHTSQYSGQPFPVPECWSAGTMTDLMTEETTLSDINTRLGTALH